VVIVSLYSSFDKVASFARLLIQTLVNRLLAYLRPFESGSTPGSGDRANEDRTPHKMRFTGMAGELLPVKDVDRDQIRLLARREVVAVLRRERRTWIHTVREEFGSMAIQLSRSEDMR
jgi:hypothetical protein